MTMTLTFVALLILTALPLGVHLGFRAPRIRETGSPADHGLVHEAIWIPTVRGRRLYGWWLPADSAQGTLVVVHGWGSNAELMLPLGVPLRRAGLNLLLFDARNHGRSDADSFSSLPRFAEDLGAALIWLKHRHPRRSARVAVLGHSVGAGAALFAASRDRDIAAVISIAAFAHPAEVTARYLAPLHLPKWVTTLVIRYVEWVIGHRFDTIAPVRSIRQVACPVLLVHGQADTLVPVEDARRILAQAQGQGARLLEVPGAGHDSVERIEDHLDAMVAFLRETGVLGPGTAYPGSGWVAIRGPQVAMAKK